MLFGERHGGIEADDGKVAGYVQDGLDDGFTHFGFGIIQLSSIVPWHGSAIVAMIDVAGAPGPAVETLKDHGRVAFLAVVIFQKDSHAIVIR